MKTTDFNEIVFENRNQEYGAYTLRKLYKKRMLIATSISIALLLMAVSFPLIAGYLNKSRVIVDSTSVYVNLLNVKDDVAPPPPPPPPPPMDINKVKPFTVPIISEDDSVSDGFTTDPDKITNNPIDTNETNIVVTDSMENKKVKIIDDVSNVPLNVEEMPEYVGGDNARVEFMSKNIVYPTMAKESGIQGTVYVKFVVEPDGSMSNITMLRGIGGGCDEEALRVVRMLPKWKPGKQNGNPVRVWFTLPIKFTLI